MVEIDKETGLPLYNSPEEVPVHEQLVPPINMDGLPRDNIICKYMECLARTSDTYPEYVMQSSFVILSAIARRRIFVKVNGREMYPVVWMVILGPSGYSRKSTSTGRARKVLKLALGENAVLADDITPEGLIEAMATKTLVKNASKCCTIWNEASEKYADKECKIMRSQRAYIRDEVSQMYAQMQKPGSMWLEQLFLKLHSGENYEKALVNKTQTIENPFFPMLLATTPEGFRRFMTKENLRSGFIARQLPTAPAYEKVRKPLQQDSENDAQFMQEVIDEFKVIDLVLGDRENGIRAGFQDGALEILDGWVAERESYYAKTRDEDHGVFVPRFQENAISMALLIELGNIPHLVAENKNLLLKNLNVTKASMGFALKLIDSVFAPYIDTLGLRDESLRVYERGDIAKVEKILMKHKKLDYSSIMRNTKLKSLTLQETLHTLLESGAIEKCFARNGKKKALWYTYIPPNSRDDSKFKTNYNVIKIDEYAPAMEFEERSEPLLEEPFEEDDIHEQISSFDLLDNVCELEE